MPPTRLVLLFTALMLTSATYAQEVIDPLIETQKVLRNQPARNKAIQEEGIKAKAADAYAEKVAGPKGKDDMYDISADLMAVLEKESEGDPKKMMKILEEAQRDPEAFYNRFPPEQKQKFQNLIKSLPKPTKP